MKQEQTINVPDIGGAKDVDVIEVLVSPGDMIEVDTPLMTLESDKASMEIPSPVAGKVVKLLAKVGDKVSQGSAILEVLGTEGKNPEKEPEKETPPPSPAATSAEKDLPPIKTMPVEERTAMRGVESADSIYAGPGVRRLARELGIDLSQISGSGKKSRITRDDLVTFIKNQSPPSGVPAMPAIDFSQFGPIETQPLNKIKRLTAQQVHRSWISIPHVTQFDEADITDLEAFRKLEIQQATQADYKLTILAFIVKAITKALIQYPQFNTSLNPAGDALIYKAYYHIGIAVETPNGLVVPVIKNADQLSVSEIAKEMARLSQHAREKGVALADMKGGTFTISSLGGIAGTAFTPIVNAPEVAILGVSKAAIKPCYQDGNWAPRLMLPLSLSYDHRVIDGAEGARFLKCITSLLTDVRRIIL